MHTIDKMFQPLQLFDLAGYAHAELFAGCSAAWEALARIDNYLAGQALGNISVAVPEGVTLVNADLISIGPGTTLEPGAYIKGPCIIGACCQIRHGAYIRGDAVIGDHCVIGHATEVKHSIFLNYAQAAHFAYVGDSILGNKVNLGAGTICANLKLDHSAIVIRYNGIVIETGLRKLGAILGDSTQIGCNTVLNPGAIFGRGVLCYACINAGGVVPANSTVSKK